MKKIDPNPFYYVLLPSGGREMIFDRRKALRFAAAYGFTVTDSDGRVINYSDPNGKYKVKEGQNGNR